MRIHLNHCASPLRRASVRVGAVAAIFAMAAFSATLVGHSWSGPDAAAPAAKGPKAGELYSRPHTTEPTTTMLFWTGKIAPGMADQIQQAFEANKQHSNRFVLVLNSGGGSVREGERVIAALQKMKSTHRFDTQVRNGTICGSMCVFIYLQGQSRFAAPSSLWLFHEVSLNEPVGDQPIILDRAAWERLVTKYYGPAGVSEQWTLSMKPKTINADFWQTGVELVQLKAGIVTHMTPNTEPRNVPTVKTEVVKPQSAPAVPSAGGQSGSGKV